MQANLTSSRKAMHELLAIVKKTTTQRKVSFDQEVELILRLRMESQGLLQIERAPLRIRNQPQNKICCSCNHIRPESSLV